MTLNYSEIEARGGLIYGDDEFRIVCCDNCGYQYLYNAEVELIYPNPENLEEKFFSFEDAFRPCKGCGLRHWGFDNLSFESQEFASGSWSWLVKR